MSTLAKRLILSAVFISIALAAIFIGPEWIFFLTVEGFILLALNEYLIMAQKKNVPVNRPLGLVLGGLLPFSFYASAEVFGLAIVVFTVFIFYFSPRLRGYAFLSTAVTSFGILYVSFFFGYLIKIHHLPRGPFWVFYILLLVKGGDAGAYFVGHRWGKTKLIEHISPNKSVEGAVACVVTTILLSLISRLYLPGISWGHLFTLGLLLGIFSQIGDLGESLLKRDVGVKDSGEVPGLGGILDILDSLILTIPLAYYFIDTVIHRAV